MLFKVVLFHKIGYFQQKHPCLWLQFWYQDNSNINFDWQAPMRYLGSTSSLSQTRSYTSFSPSSFCIEFIFCVTEVKRSSRQITVLKKRVFEAEDGIFDRLLYFLDKVRHFSSLVHIFQYISPASFKVP